jgi:hypothetical protein
MEKNNFEMAEQTQEAIRRYLAGRMTEAERVAFEQQLKADADLAGEVRYQASLARALRGADMLDIGRWVREGAGQPVDPAPDFPMAGRRGRWNGWIGGALLAAVLITLGGWQLLEARKQARLDAAIELYWQPAEVVLGVDAADDAALVAGLAAYQGGKYAEARERLEDYYRRSGDLNAALYAGIAALFAGDGPAAAAQLDRVTRQGEAPAAEIARWYRTLAWLRAKDVGAALELLRNWPAGGLYAQPAQELRERLEGL